MGGRLCIFFYLFRAVFLRGETVLYISGRLRLINVHRSMLSSFCRARRIDFLTIVLPGLKLHVRGKTWHQAGTEKSQHC